MNQLIRNPTGRVPLARLGDRVLMAEWEKRPLPHEVVVEWRLTLDDKPVALVDKETGAPAIIALHRWEDGGQPTRRAERREDGTWTIVLPIAWHSMCAAFSGTITLELDAERLEARYSDEIAVEL